MPYLDRDGPVYVLNLGERGRADTENRCSVEWMTEVGTLLDEVESAGAVSLVTTGDGKYYSNGFEIERLVGDHQSVRAYLLQGQALFSRLLTSSVPTVAALQGHTYAAGAVFALAHDRRVMRADRGYFCLPEIALDLPWVPHDMAVPSGVTALVCARLSQQVAHEALLTGRRYGGAEAHAARIVDEAVPEEALLTEAIRIAGHLAPTAGPRLQTMKRWMYRQVVTELRGFAGPPSVSGAQTGDPPPGPVQ